MDYLHVQADNPWYNYYLLCNMYPLLESLSEQSNIVLFLCCLQIQRLYFLKRAGNFCSKQFVFIHEIFNFFLSSLCSWANWFESHFVRNREDRVSHVGANLYLPNPFDLQHFFLLDRDATRPKCTVSVCRDSV